MRRMRTVFVLVALVSGALALVGPAAADPPSIDTADVTGVFCEFEADFGSFELFVGREVNDDGTTTWSDMEVFAEEDFIFSEEPTQLTFEDGALTLELPLFSELIGGPIGHAIIAEGSYEQLGELELVDQWVGKSGNVREEGQVFFAPLVLDGLLEVSIDGFEPAEFALSDCEGFREVAEVWHTNPQAFVLKAEGTYLFCELESDGWFVGLFGFDEGFGGVIELEAWAPDAEETPTYVGFVDAVRIDIGDVYAEVDLWEPMSEEPADVAILDATLAKGALFDIQNTFMEGYNKIEVYELVVEGSLTLPTGVVFDMSPCGGEHSEQKVFVNDNLPSGKGQPPGNDLPTGAVELTNRDNVQTRMAAEEPEAACIDPRYGDVPLGRTVWYTVEGTGDAITIDTAGSDFDTVVGVYTMEGDEYVQHACLDDIWDDTQFNNVVALTFDTQQGETYYVQVGGFAAQYGLLKVGLG